MLTGKGTKLTRPLLWIGQAVRHPIRLARTLWPVRWSRRTVILLVMQTLDNAIRLRSRRRLLGRGARLQTEQDPERPIPTFIPVANWAAERMAEKVGGLAQGGTTESVFNIPTTAHILGGAVIGADAGSGVVDSSNRVFGYQDLLVCDGASVPANPGVNPSLTIAALAERAMSLVAPPDGAAEDGASRSPPRTVVRPPAS